MVSSTESAMSSRLTSELFIPWWPMAMPSVTVMVVNSRGVPPALATPFFTTCACRASVMLHGAASFQVVATPDERRVDLRLAEAHRVEVRAVRCALRPLGDVARNERRFAEFLGHDGFSIGENRRDGKEAPLFAST